MDKPEGLFSGEDRTDMQGLMNPYKVEEYLNRMKVITIPVREFAKFLREMSKFIGKELKLPDDFCIVRAWYNSNRSCFQFEVCSWTYKKTDPGLEPQEIYLHRTCKEER